MRLVLGFSIFKIFMGGNLIEKIISLPRRYMGVNIY